MIALIIFKKVFWEFYSAAFQLRHYLLSSEKYALNFTAISDVKAPEIEN